MGAEQGVLGEAIMAALGLLETMIGCEGTAQGVMVALPSIILQHDVCKRPSDIALDRSRREDAP